MNLDQVMQTFIAESRELLEQMENALLLVARQEAAALGKTLRVHDASAAVRDVFALLGIGFAGIDRDSGEQAAGESA